MPFTSEQLSAWSQLAINWGLSLLGAVVILVIGWLVAGWAARMVRRAGERSDRIDRTITGVLARITRIAILVVTLLAVLDRFGVETTSIVALLGAAGLAVGLALQGALGNVASGLMILGLRPFRVGDAIDLGDASGTVEDIGLFVTRLKTFDGLAVHVPNSNVWGKAIKNFTQNDTRRVELTFGIGYDDDIGHALRVLEQLVAADTRILVDPAPRLAVTSLGDSSVNLLVWVWVQRSDFLDVKLELTRRAKERFDEEGISIPFPQRDVHLFQQEAPAPAAEGAGGRN